MKTETIMKTPFTFGDWHAWNPDNAFHPHAIMLSDESRKKLRSFVSVDETINWLYTNGHKEAARALNRHAK